MMKFNIIAHRRVWYLLSGMLVMLSVIFIFVPGVRFGIDFTGGSLTEIAFELPVKTADLRSSLQALGYQEATIQQTGDQGVLIRTKNLREEEHQALLNQLKERHGEFEELRFDAIGPVIGNELRRTATLGVILTLVLIGLYVAWAYRKVTQPVAAWKYGVLTILAAFHDVIIAVGVFAVAGQMVGWEVGTSFVAAVLTILGYSINDTVVVLDRTRENLLKGIGESFADTVELSIHQTFWRSLNTTLTTVFALAAVFFFGGESTQPFAFALIVGIGVGAYSSLFLASPLLVTWQAHAAKQKR